MKKHRLIRTLVFTFSFSLFTLNLHSQWVNIPDPNFVSWLNANGYSYCMSGSLMDTTCWFITSETGVNCSYSNIQDLSGIEYFDNLRYLDCGYNQLTGIPFLPGLTELYCSHNQLNSLPVLPNGLQKLHCYNNNLSSLPELPNMMSDCYISNNPIRCLPKLKRITNLEFENTQVICLPNYGSVTSSTPLLNSLPLCNLLNESGCPSYWNISGSTYLDENSNCTKDTNDTEYRSVKINLLKGSNLVEQIYTGDGGFYSFNTDSFGVYELKVETLSVAFNVACPANNSLFVTVAPGIYYNNQNFGLTCKPGFDLVARSIYGFPYRAGRQTRVDITAGDLGLFYGTSCASGVSGTVTVTLSGPVQYVSPVQGALTPVVSANTLIYHIADFGSMSYNTDFNIIVQTDTAAVFGSQVCFTVSVTPTIGDLNPANNTLTHCFTVIGSYDPNDKQVYPVSDVNIDGEHWLTYSVRFQNTGNDTAFNIFITDTLDNDLDVSTFELLAYSHRPFVQIKENAVQFNFPNIMLPDSNVNEALSHGYVQYKIKIKDGKPVGTVINNTAFIYFDFNAPVVTNTTSNTLAVVSSVEEMKNEKLEMRIYPNPTSNSVTISVDGLTGGTLSITDITGRNVAPVNLITQYSLLNTYSFAKGIFFVRLRTPTGSSVVKKLVVE